MIPTVQIKTYGNKQYMKGNQEAWAMYGLFSVDGKHVVYSVCGVTESEAYDCYTDDLSELKCGNVDFLTKLDVDRMSGTKKHSP